MINMGFFNIELNGMLFSILDWDNDWYSGYCVIKYSGGWWFNNCYDVYFNGFWVFENWYDLWYLIIVDGINIVEVWLMIRLI